MPVLRKFTSFKINILCYVVPNAHELLCPILCQYQCSTVCTVQTDIRILVSVFTPTNVETVADDLYLQLLDLQRNNTLKEYFQDSKQIEFYSTINARKFDHSFVQHL